MTEMVGADLRLEAVGGHRMRDGHHAGVVDQDVDGVHPVGELPHRGQILQVESAHLDVSGHVPGGGFALSGVAYGQDDLSTDAGQLAGRHRAEAAVGAGHDDGTSGE